MERVDYTALYAENEDFKELSEKCGHTMNRKK